MTKDGAMLVQYVENSAATVLCSAQESVSPVTPSRNWIGGGSCFVFLLMTFISFVQSKGRERTEWVVRRLGRYSGKRWRRFQTPSGLATQPSAATEWSDVISRCHLHQAGMSRSIDSRPLASFARSVEFKIAEHVASCTSLIQGVGSETVPQLL